MGTIEVDDLYHALDWLHAAQPATERRLARGCPVAAEVFPGNSADPSTMAAQVAKIKERFGIQR
ncbi:MAG: hypothetical protein WC100_22430, partial [Sterolibacterium sp.]